jgi:uncharacterized protein YbjT (DUF2867 family)
MKVLVVGAAGVIGRQLVPLLVKSDHEVVGTTRRAEKIQLLQELGAAPVIVDVFDREGLLCNAFVCNATCNLQAKSTILC